VSVGILLVAHDSLGTVLLRIAAGIFGALPPNAESLDVENDSPCDQVLERARAMVERLDTGEGVLVLTDIYGATPANLARSLLDGPHRVRLLAGVNLPMLVRALTYAHLDLESAMERALIGGRDGVLLCAAHCETD
jgi:mannose PTS system EIIA component